MSRRNTETWTLRGVLSIMGRSLSQLMRSVGNLSLLGLAAHYHLTTRKQNTCSIHADPAACGYPPERVPHVLCLPRLQDNDTPFDLAYEHCRRCPDGDDVLDDWRVLFGMQV